MRYDRGIPGIPYFAQPRLTVAGHSFYAFGFLVAVAVLYGWRMVVRRAGRLGIERAAASRITVHMLLRGFVGSHALFLLLFEEPGPHPAWRALNPFTGMYSFGGIVVGLLAAVISARRAGLTRKQFWTYLDVLGFVFPSCWALARTGCFLAHDHIGRRSDSWIAVRFPGGARFDLGLIEALFAAAAAILFVALDRRRPVPYLGLWLILYGPFRLWLDTLHDGTVGPDRYFGGLAVVLGAAVLIAGRGR